MKVVFEGSNAEARLAQFLAQLIREGLTFDVTNVGDMHGYRYTVLLGGGF